MLRCVLWSAGAGLLGLMSMSGCTPGPVTARSAGDGTGGNAGGGGVRVMGRDASTSERDGASAAPGSAGAGGSNARQMLDAGLFADGPLPETPKLPVRDGAAADGRTNGTDALRDASRDIATARAPRAGEVAIDELLVNPTGDDLGREWIELANRASEPLDLSQLHLATASTDVAAPAGTLGPGALLLMGQSMDPSKNGGAPVSLAYNAKLILNNANGQLSICVGACASGVVIATVSWGTLSDDQTGHALIVDPATMALCAAWTPFGTAGSFGTPGAPNPPCVENVDGGSRRDVSVAD